MNFGERLKNVRKQQKVSQKELGQRLGVSQQTIAQYEKAQSTPKAITVNKIANALDVNPQILLDEIPPRIKEYARKITETVAEEKLLSIYRHLNDDGKNKIIEYSEDIQKIPEYRADEQPPAVESPTPSDQDE